MSPVVLQRRRRLALLIALLSALALLATACGGGAAQDPGATEEDTEAEQNPGEETATEAEEETEAATEDAEGPLTVYSGRSEELVGPLLERFTEDSGIEVDVRYGDTAELAAQILEEGDNTPADVFFGQDAGALGALAGDGALAELPQELLDQVDERFRATDDTWVGASGRARVIVHNTDTIPEDEVPDSVLELTEPEYAGRVGWAPTNGSFQAFVTAMRVELGDDAAREWLEGMIANDTPVFENNTAIVEAVGRGEIDFGLVNHYYLYQFLNEDPAFPVANSLPEGGDLGALVNVAGAGVLATTDQPGAAEEFVAYLLSDDAQTYFVEETSEYPLTGAEEAPEGLPPLEELDTPDVDLADLADLEGTLDLLRETGALT
ncbi:MAG: extracellular solute-binding protein [Nitriliruptorales bacterium]|nr:extracellular solute-binding protein [Nitriliruptorales bacterium]